MQKPSLEKINEILQAKGITGCVLAVGDQYSTWTTEDGHQIAFFYVYVTDQKEDVDWWFRKEQPETPEIFNNGMVISDTREMCLHVS